MVIPRLLCGEGSSKSAVGTSVICFMCCLFFVSQLGCGQVQNLPGDCNVFGSLNIFSKKCYDL